MLGAAVWQERPSPVFAERLNHAIWLLQQQRVDYLILTGGRGEGDTQAEAEVARRYALQAGVPGERILTESVSTITAENLSEACGLMRRHGLQSALIVSDPLHMQRAMLLARDIGIRAHAAPMRRPRRPAAIEAGRARAPPWPTKPSSICLTWRLEAWECAAG